MPSLTQQQLPALALLGALVVGACTGTVATTGSDNSEPERREIAAVPTLLCTPDEGDALYNQRIAPLLAEDRPKTCNECHLSGIDLSMVVKATPCETMACMVERDLVDLDAPSESLVLSWIERADPSSPLITEDVIAEEYAGFLAWIEYASACGSEACAPVENPCGDSEPPGPDACPHSESEGGPDPDFEDPGDCSDRTLEALFQQRVYAWRGRCSPCHFDSSKVDAPKWITTGSCNSASLATMRNVLDGGLVDLESPAQSKLLLKPLAEAAGGIQHGGHDKFSSSEDAAYLDIRAWIERRAECE